MENQKNNMVELTSQEALFLFQQHCITFEECQQYLDIRAQIVKDAVKQSMNTSNNYDNENVRTTIQMV